MVYLPKPPSSSRSTEGCWPVSQCSRCGRRSVPADWSARSICSPLKQDYEDEGMTEAMLAELIRSARNKGCAVLEGDVPAEPAELARWEAAGFAAAGPRLRCPLVRAAALSNLDGCWTAQPRRA